MLKNLITYQFLVLLIMPMLSFGLDISVDFDPRDPEQLQTFNCIKQANSSGTTSNHEYSSVVHGNHDFVVTLKKNQINLSAPQIQGHMFASNLNHFNYQEILKHQKKKTGWFRYPALEEMINQSQMVMGELEPNVIWPTYDEALVSVKEFLPKDVRVLSIDDPEDVWKKIRRIENGYLITLPDSMIYNKKNLPVMIESLYRKGVPVVGFSLGFLQFGASLAFETEKENYCKWILEKVDSISKTKRLPDAEYSPIMRVHYNRPVLKSLNIPVPEIR